MSNVQEVRVPDLGEFDSVEIIEVHVSAGDTVAAEDPLITLESDKAAMEVPAPFGGVVKEIVVAPGDKVSQGDLIAQVEAAAGEASAKADAPASEAPAAAAAAPSIPAGDYDGPVDLQTRLVVLGAGPGGYTAAFRAVSLVASWWASASVRQVTAALLEA